MEPNQRYRPTERMVARTIRQETVLVPVAASLPALESLYSLNRTATCIWEGAVAGQTQAEIVRTLLARFEVTPECAAGDVRRVLEDLLRIGAIEPLSAP